MHERQFHRVGDLLDLSVEAADIVVAGVGHLLQDEILHLGAGQALDDEIARGVDEHVVAAADRLGRDHRTELDNPLLVGAAQHDGPVAPRQQLLDGGYLSGAVRPAGQHHAERFVESDLLAGLEVVGELGMDRDPHLAAPGPHVHCAVVVAPEHGAVTAGRLGELLDLLAQRADVLAGVPEHGREPLILRHGLGETTLRVGQPLLEHPHPLGCVVQAPPQRGNLALELGHKLAQTVQISR